MTDQPLDVTTADGLFHVEGVAQCLSVVRRTVIGGGFFRVLPADGDYFSEGAFAATVYALASDLAAARAELAEKDRLLGMAREALVKIARGEAAMTVAVRILTHFPPTTKETSK